MRAWERDWLAGAMAALAANNGELLAVARREFGKGPGLDNWKLTLGVDAFRCHGGDRWAAVAFGGVEGHAHGLHAGLGSPSVAGMAGRDGLESFLLHHLQGGLLIGVWDVARSENLGGGHYPTSEEHRLLRVPISNCPRDGGTLHSDQYRGRGRQDNEG